MSWSVYNQGFEQVLTASCSWQITIIFGKTDGLSAKSYDLSCQFTLIAAHHFTEIYSWGWQLSFPKDVLGLFQFQPKLSNVPLYLGLERVSWNILRHLEHVIQTVIWCSPQDMILIFSDVFHCCSHWLGVRALTWVMSSWMAHLDLSHAASHVVVLFLHNRYLLLQQIWWSLHDWDEPADLRFLLPRRFHFGLRFVLAAHGNLLGLGLARVSLGLRHDLGVQALGHIGDVLGMLDLWTVFVCCHKPIRPASVLEGHLERLSTLGFAELDGLLFQLGQWHLTDLFQLILRTSLPLWHCGSPWAFATGPWWTSAEACSRGTWAAVTLDPTWLGIGVLGWSSLECPAWFRTWLLIMCDPDMLCLKPSGNGWLRTSDIGTANSVLDSVRQRVNFRKNILAWFCRQSLLIFP